MLPRYRLRLWGLVLSTVTTVAIGALSMTSLFGLRDAGPIPYAFAGSAAIQNALLAPLFVALAALSVITVATSHSLIRF